MGCQFTVESELRLIRLDEVTGRAAVAVVVVITAPPQSVGTEAALSPFNFAPESSSDFDSTVGQDKIQGNTHVSRYRTTNY